MYLCLIYRACSHVTGFLFVYFQRQENAAFGDSESGSGGVDDADLEVR